jgi:DNA-binding IclR family transcriptional regulator
MTEPTRAVDRALDILLCFTRQTPALSMTQIAEMVGMNKSTVHRMLGTLESKRFIQRDPVTGIYRLGIRILQMAYLTLEQNELRLLAAPYLRKLCDDHRETITLSVLDDADVVFLDVIESPQRVKLAASTGQRLPASATAAGKAMLAHLPEATIRKTLERKLQAYTATTIQSLDVLINTLALVRAQGYATAEQEYEDGINAVAAPVLNSARQPIAAITVTGPAYRFPASKMNEIGPSLALVAKDVGRGVETNGGGR